MPDMNANECLEKIETGENCDLNYKKGYKNEGPLNYFEKILTYEFKNSMKVNILKKNLEIQNRIQKVTILCT